MHTLCLKDFNRTDMKVEVAIFCAGDRHLVGQRDDKKRLCISQTKHHQRYSPKIINAYHAFHQMKVSLQATDLTIIHSRKAIMNINSTTDQHQKTTLRTTQHTN